MARRRTKPNTASYMYMDDFGSYRSQSSPFCTFLAESVGSGIFMGIALRTGLSVDPFSLCIMVIEAISDAVPNTSMDISFYILLVGIMPYLITLFTLFDASRRLDSLALALIFYGICYLSGIILVLSVVPQMHIL